MEIDSKTQINSYLTFKIGVEEFGIQVNKVLNILELQEITNVPKSPEYMKGVINLRGTILPIIDTRIKFEMTPTEFTDDTCIVVMDLVVEDEIMHVGALVDSVVAVREIDESQINPSPNIGKSYKSEFISGLVKINESFVMILDVIKLFTGEDLKDLN
ncbi:MAG: chemotaxis protein CheW [Bacteroidales bacterium]|nr:chemotaxis protein CheW [Bacteroidales bacterium]